MSGGRAKRVGGGPAEAVRRLGSLAGFVWSHPANRGRRLRALARAAGWQLRKRMTRRALDVRVYGGLTLRCYHDSTPASGVIYAAGYPDWAEMSFLSHLLRPGDGFVDVGANIGVYTLLAASRVGREGRLACFEPGALALLRLRENLSLNGIHNAEVFPAAALHRAGTVRFDEAGSTTGHVVADAEAAGVEVPCVRLDDVLAGGSRAAGKMDVEGAEPLALRGAERLLAEMNPPVWLLEVNGVLRRYGFTKTHLWGWLAARAWDVCVYDPARRLLLDCPDPRSRHRNVLAVARGARPALGARLVAG